MLPLIHTLAQASPAPPPGVGGTGQWLTWGIVLLGVALALFFLEVFIPSGGLIGITAGVAAVFGIVFMFRVDTTLGLITAAVALLALPFLVGFALKVWPHTPFGKWVTLDDEPDDISDRSHPGAPPTPTAHPDRPRIAVGDTGKALTPLRPVGTVMLHGRREECLAQGNTIASGTDVRVVVVDGNEVYVRPVGRHPTPPPAPPAPTRSG